ncbi:actin family [Fimicolochytrium jonesii]|uniref:actin family n=1 Tax=Fimicolochytrium jonesii TaxID=1396493 RepID=UPI0022FF45D3|nr:actin family [Fimicolochytrium jonesii]KAI8819907.1 actin family [Fimicolochytrium jonesii]
MITQVNPRESRLLVLETGSYRTKAGAADHMAYTIVSTPSIVGLRPRKQQQQQSQSPQKDTEIEAVDTAAAGTVEPSQSESEVMDVDTADNTGVTTPAEPAEPTVIGEESEFVYVAGSKVLEFDSTGEGVEGGDANESGLVHPIENGLPVDWPALLGLWQHILLKSLPTRINRSRNDWSLMMTVPVSWSKEDHKRVTQFIFEELNMLAFTIIEQPLAALYGHNMSTGLIIDIGHETTDITPVIDNSIVRYAHKTIPLGGRDIDRQLLELLKADTQFMQELGVVPLTEEVARTVKESCCELSLLPYRVEPKDKIERAKVTINGKEVTIGTARFLAAEVLFDPSLASKSTLNIPEACYLAVTEACEPEKRTSLWEAIVLTGGSCQIKGMRGRLDKELGKLISASETSNEFQAKEIKWAGLPEYFPSYKEKQQDVGFLGASVVARIVFTSSSFAYVTKTDYNELGPSAICLKS